MLLEKYSIWKAEAIERSNIERGYAYQILRGVKNAKRDKAEERVISGTERAGFFPALLSSHSHYLYGLFERLCSLLTKGFKGFRQFFVCYTRVYHRSRQI
jgi:hypothetical protein